VRLFLALNLPPSERQAIVAAMAPMRAAARGVAWTTEERLHLTLKFLGEQPEHVVAAIGESLGTAMAAHAPVVLRLSGFGAFPNLRAPRIVWLGVEGDPKLELLHHDVERTCADLGFELDGRAFRPHITVGRVRDRLAPDAARDLAAAARRVAYSGTVEATTVDLMASELLSSGPRYTVLAAIPLGGE
jgi:2'-5' RNA ligase